MGAEQRTVRGVEREIGDNLCRNGWDGRCAAIAIEPELENWIWTPSPHTAKALGWDSYDELCGWLKERSLMEDGRGKPGCPKKAMRRALREKNIGYSASNFKLIAERAQLRYCEDGASRKFKDTLCNWFPSRDSQD